MSPRDPRDHRRDEGFDRGETRCPEPRPEGAPKFLESVTISDTMVRFDLDHLPVEESSVVFLAASGAQRSERYQLHEGRTTLGRSEEADIRLASPNVSRLHASFVVRDTTVQLTDEASSNGTFVNGTRVQEAQLRDGDIAEFGEFRFVVIIRRPVTVAPPADEPVSKAPVEAHAPAAEAHAPAAEALDRERRQLALLLQISLRYLAAAPDADLLALLFDVLPRVIPFTGAFVGLPLGDELGFYSHPRGIELTEDQCRRLVSDAAAVPVVHDGYKDVVRLPTLSVRSRALVPLAGGYLVLLHREPLMYALELDFLSVLARIHSTAVDRQG